MRTIEFSDGILFIKDDTDMEIAFYNNIKNNIIYYDKVSFEDNSMIILECEKFRVGDRNNKYKNVMYK